MQTPISTICHVALNTPERTAIVHEATTVSFGELVHGAAELAIKLQALGVTPGCFVALYAEKNADWFTAMLAVQLCDAAYIPLDVSYPAERIAYCIENAGAQLVLTDSKHQPRIGGHTVILSELIDGTRSESARELLQRACARNASALPAYVIYTSGSTGQPKGVVVSQRALAFHMHWMNDEFRWSDEDVFIQKSSISFDASVWEYFAPLMSGARFVISGADPAEILENINHHHVTVAQFVPTVLRFINETGQAPGLKGLRLLFSGGEAITKALADALIAQTQAELVNLYGPTETTIQCCFYRYSPHHRIQGDALPIGNTLPGVSYEVVTAEGKHDGTQGELIISGPNVASGYINNPSATAEKFIVDSAGVPIRYRTGDIVRRADDGMLYFIGRRDHQIKLRGLRIEKDEIAKTAHAFSEAINATHLDVVNEDSLFMWLESQTGIDDEALRQHLSRTLPAWMIPSRFITLSAFPTLPNGKINVNALTAIRTNKIRPAGHQIPAGLEEFKARWSALVGDEVDSGESLLSQGVNSLHCVRAARMMLDSYHVNLSSAAIMNSGNLEKLYKMVCASPPAWQEKQVAQTPAVIPLSEPQQGILFSALNESEPLNWDLHYHVTIKHRTQDEILRALAVMSQRHPALRVRIKANPQGLFAQHIASPAECVPDILDATHASGVKKQGMSVIDNPLWKVISLAKRDEYLFIFHHVIFDGYSADIFFSELGAILSGQELSLESDLSFLQHCAASAAVAETSDLLWWERALSMVAEESRIAPEFRCGARLTPRGESLSVDLSPESHSAITRFSRQRGVTPFNLLLSTTALTLSEFIKKEAFCLGVPVFGRSAEEAGSLGNFVDVLPVPFRFGDKSEHLLEQACKTFAACLEHSAVSVNALIRRKVRSKGTGSRPLWQNTFVYNECGNAPDGLEWRYEHTESPKADSAFVITRSEKKTTLRLEYCSDILTPATADAMMSAWLRNLELHLSGNDDVVRQYAPSDDTLTEAAPVTVADADAAYLHEVLSLFRQYLGEEVNAQDDFFLSGGHSLLAIRILNALGKRYGKHLPSYLIFEGRNALNIAVSLKEIAEPGGNHRISGVAKLTEGQPGQHVWFIHPAGGALWCYQDIAEKLLPRQIGSYGIECVPDASTGKFINNINEMAQRYCLDMLDRDPAERYTIIGYSFGGNVAYEIGRLLTQHYGKRCKLILLDSHICAVKPFRQDDFTLSYATKFTEGKPHLLDINKLYPSSGAIDFAYIKSIGISTGHITADTPLADIESGLSMWLANNEAVHSHDPVGTFEGECLFIRATKNPSDSTSGWDNHLKKMKVVTVDAGHFDIYKSPATQDVASHLATFVNMESYV